MTGKKTHDLQRQIIEKRIDTSNADKDFDPRPDLKAAEEPGARPAQVPPSSRPPSEPEDGDPTPRGLNQESQHHKNRGRPEDQD